MKTHSGKVVSLPASTRADNLIAVEPEPGLSTADAGRTSLSLPILSPQVTYTGAIAILESQDITSDTELLAVADTLLSMGSKPSAEQQMLSAPLLPLPQFH